MTTLKQKPYVEICTVTHRYKLLPVGYCKWYLDAKENFEVSQR